MAFIASLIPFFIHLEPKPCAHIPVYVQPEFSDHSGIFAHLPFKTHTKVAQYSHAIFIHSRWSTFRIGDNPQQSLWISQNLSPNLWKIQMPILLWRAQYRQQSIRAWVSVQAIGVQLSLLRAKPHFDQNKPTSLYPSCKHALTKI